jgi:hypothetical protein
MEEELDPGVEWIKARQAADILGITPRRVRQLANLDRLPYVRLRGQYHFRQRQVEVIANARQRRWLRLTDSPGRLRGRNRSARCSGPGAIP